MKIFAREFLRENIWKRFKLILVYIIYLLGYFKLCSDNIINIRLKICKSYLKIREYIDNDDSAIIFKYEQSLSAFTRDKNVEIKLKGIENFKIYKRTNY